MQALQRVVFLTLNMAALAFALPAAASPDYPQLVADELGALCAPCTLCHEDPIGGYRTATKPFLLQLAANVSEAPKGNDPDLMRKLLREYRAHPGDADGDGVNDVQELQNGDDPNVKGPGLLCADYGCAARVEPRGRFDPLVFAVSLLAVLGLIARFRSRSRSR